VIEWKRERTKEAALTLSCSHRVVICHAILRHVEGTKCCRCLYDAMCVCVYLETHIKCVPFTPPAPRIHDNTQMIFLFCFALHPFAIHSTHFIFLLSLSQVKLAA
jgi:hypothetical protein